MIQSKYVEELITNLSVALGHALTYSVGHPHVEQSLRSVIRVLRAACKAGGVDAVEICVVNGQFVESGRVLISSTITGRKLVELVRSCSAGGLVLGGGADQTELQRFLQFAIDLPIGIRPLVESRAELTKAGVSQVQLPETNEEFQWYGDNLANASTWSSAGIDLEDALPVYQSMYENVAGSMRQAASGGLVDMNEARSISESLRDATVEGFDDLFQLAGTPNYDAYTVGHSTRVALLAVYVGKSLGATQEVLTELGAAGLMHDVGKGRIPYEILYKPARLDNEEWEVMATHPTLGVEILLESSDVSACALGAAWGHHLRFDGAGYPKTSAWAQSSRMTSLIQVCDVFEALTAKRPYKAALSPTRAYEIMFSDAGSFNPATLAAFTRAMGLFPPGNFVRLSDDRVGRVHCGGTRLDRPIVRTLPTGDIVDLGSPDQSHLAVKELLDDQQAQAALNLDGAEPPQEAESPHECESESEAPGEGTNLDGCPLC